MTALTVARSIRRGAHQLAAQIEHEFTGLTPEQRGDLRMLPCDMLAWADELDPAGAVGTMPTPVADVIRPPQFQREPDVGRMILGEH